MLTKEHFAFLLMDIAQIQKGDNDSYYTVYHANEDCPYDIMINFFYEKERIVVIAHAPQMKIRPYEIAKAIAFCNRINKEYLNQSVYYYADSNELRMSGCLFTDCEISDEYIQSNFMRFYIHAALNFFTEAGRIFPPFD